MPTMFNVGSFVTTNSQCDNMSYDTFGIICYNEDEH